MPNLDIGINDLTAKVTVDVHRCFDVKVTSGHYCCLFGTAERPVAWE